MRAHFLLLDLRNSGRFHGGRHCGGSGIVTEIHFHRVIPYICCLRYNDGRQLTNIRLLCFPLQVDCGSVKDINATSSSSSFGNDLPLEEYSTVF